MYPSSCHQNRNCQNFGKSSGSGAVTNRDISGSFEKTFRPSGQDCFSQTKENSSNLNKILIIYILCYISDEILQEKKSVLNLWDCQSTVWSLLISLFIQKNRVHFLLLKTRQRLCTLPIDAQACLFLIQFHMLVTLNLSKTWKRCSLIGQHRWCLNASWMTQGVRCKKVYFLQCHSKFYPTSVCSTR